MKKNSCTDLAKLKKKLHQLMVSLMSRKKNYSLQHQVMYYLQSGLIQSGKDIILKNVGKQQFSIIYDKLIDKIYNQPINNSQSKKPEQKQKLIFQNDEFQDSLGFAVNNMYKKSPQIQSTKKINEPLINRDRFRSLQESKPIKTFKSKSPGQEMLRHVCQQESQQNFQLIKQKLDAMVLLQDMVVYIAEYAGKKQAEIIAKILYQEQKKGSIKVNMLDRLYSQCAKENFSDERIQKIKFLVSWGKKQAVYRQLIAECGQAKGKKLFQMAEDDIPYKQPKPISGTIKIKQKNGVEIRKYQCSMSNFDKQTAKNVLVLGQTGCGKSTFINSLVNYLLRVEIDDPFRYYLIVENQENQINSITQTITDYYIKDSMSGDVYRLIDTPGFGDTQGLQNDSKIVEMITNKFKTDLQTIHCVLFVMKSSNTRVGVYQKYVFDSVMDLFDTSIAPNFAFIFTFSDSGVPAVLDHVKQREKGFGKYWNQIVEPKYIKVNSCGIFQKIDPQDKINMGYWEISHQSIKQLFFKINSIQAKSMQLSKQLIFMKENLLNQIKTTFQTLQRSITNRQNVKKFIQMIVSCAKQMDANKSFQQEIDQAYWQQVTYAGNVTRCMSSQACMRKNCHKGCRYTNGPDKALCCAMKDEYCTVCGCHWSGHINSNKIFQQKTRKKTVTDQTLKHMYQKNKANKSLSEAALQDKIRQLEEQVEIIAEATDRIQRLQGQLSEMQMSDKKPESTMAYIDYLIKEEQRQQNPGYSEKVRKLLIARKELELHQQIVNGTLDEQMKNRKTITQFRKHKPSQSKVTNTDKQKTKEFIEQMKSRYAQEMKSNLDPSVWNKIKGLFS